jgi:signal transduction histidine kinase
VSIAADPAPESDREDPSGFRQAVRYQQALQRLLQDLASPLALKEVGRRIAVASRELFSHDAFILVLFVAGPQETIAVYLEDTPEGEAVPKEILPGPQGPSEIARELALGGEAQLINRLKVPESTPFVPFGAVERLSRSLMFAPIRWKGAVVGFLSAQSYRPGRYWRSDLQDLQSFADLCGGVLERLRVEEQLRQSEEQLRHAQKMEAVGRLAGGVAHDFNNLLTAIIGQAHLLRSELSPGPSRSRVEEILRVAGRASELTRQLLAFGRRQVLKPREINLNETVADVVRMLRSTIGEDIELVTNADPGLDRVFADRGQMEQALLNLAVNARDAMPKGGRLMIATSNSEPPAAVAGREIPKGPCVLLEVSDSGIGMGPEVLAHLFEPFFTTKEMGKGTGLGLSSVYGVVKQSGGHISVESTPGAGSTFRIYLPRFEPPA